MRCMLALFALAMASCGGSGAGPTVVEIPCVADDPHVRTETRHERSGDRMTTRTVVAWRAVYRDPSIALASPPMVAAYACGRHRVGDPFDLYSFDLEPPSVTESGPVHGDPSCSTAVSVEIEDGSLSVFCGEDITRVTVDGTTSTTDRWDSVRFVID